MFLSAIVMACGKGERFGSNKLMAKLKGKELIRYTLDALPAELFSEILVVTKYKEILDLVTEYPAPFLEFIPMTPKGDRMRRYAAVCAIFPQTAMAACLSQQTSR